MRYLLSLYTFTLLTFAACDTGGVLHVDAPDAGGTGGSSTTSSSISGSGGTGGASGCTPATQYDAQCISETGYPQAHAETCVDGGAAPPGCDPAVAKVYLCCVSM